MLYLARDAKLDSVYSNIGDNRQLRGELEDLQKTWASLNEEVQGHHQKDALHAIQRDGHCHEAVSYFRCLCAVWLIEHPGDVVRAPPVERRQDGSCSDRHRDSFALIRQP